MIKSNEDRLFFKMADKLGVTTQNLKLAYKLSVEEIESEDSKSDSSSNDTAPDSSAVGQPVIDGPVDADEALSVDEVDSTEDQNQDA